MDLVAAKEQAEKISWQISINRGLANVIYKVLVSEQKIALLDVQKIELLNGRITLLEANIAALERQIKKLQTGR